MINNNQDITQTESIINKDNESQNENEIRNNSMLQESQIQEMAGVDKSIIDIEEDNISDEEIPRYTPKIPKDSMVPFEELLLDVEGYANVLSVDKFNSDDFNGINKQQAEINDYITGIETTINETSTKIEADFKKNMESRQLEVRKFINEVVQEIDDDKVEEDRSLILNALKKENEVKYRDQSKLKEQLQGVTKEYMKYKTVAENKESDNKYLKTKIEQTERNIRTLTKSLDNARDGNQTTATSFNSSAKKPKAIVSGHELRRMDDYQGRQESKILRSQNKVKDANDQDGDLAVFKKVVDSYNKKIESYQQKIESEKKLIKTIKNRMYQDNYQKTQYEEQFEDCMDQVKRDIFRRKIYQSMRMTKKKLVDQEEFDVQIEQILNNKSREEIDFEIPFDKFTSKDKVRLVELLYSNDRVLMQIYDQLFPLRNIDTHFKFNPQGEVINNQTNTN